MSNKIQTNQSENSNTKNNAFKQQSTYDIDGKIFIVEPIFKENSSQTLGSVLLRLMKSKE